MDFSDSELDNPVPTYKQFLRTSSVNQGGKGSQFRQTGGATPSHEKRHNPLTEKHDPREESFFADHDEKIDSDHILLNSSSDHAKMIVDTGASKAMGSEHLVQSIHNLMGGTVNNNSSIPFKFAGGGKETCAKTYKVNVPFLGRNAQFQIHSIQSNGTPPLLSMEQLTKMDAVLYCRNGILSVKPQGGRKRIFFQLEKEKSGHLTMDLKSPKQISSDAGDQVHFDHAPSNTSKYSSCF